MHFVAIKSDLKLIRSSCMLISASNFYKLPAMMQSSCVALSYMMRAGFMIIALRQSNSPPSGKVKPHQDHKRQDMCRAKCIHIFFLSSVYKELISAGQIVYSTAYVMFCGSCMKICKTITSKFGDQRTGCCITVTHCLTFLSLP